MKRRQAKNIQARNDDPFSQSSLKECDSDIDDIEEDYDSECGYDARMSGYISSDPIENISDDDFYNDDDHPTTRNDNATLHSPDDMYPDDIKTFTDDDNSGSDNDNSYELNRPTFRKKFKPFKALEGLEQWRPISAKIFDDSMRNANTNNDSDDDDIENNSDRIENVYSDMVMDTTNASSIPTNDISMDSIVAVSPSLSPTTTTRRNSINYSSKNDSTPETATPTAAPQPSFSRPSFSLYHTKTQDTPKNMHSVKRPAFILDNANSNTSTKHQLPIKKGGLASLALDCINQELSKFREWQSSVLAEMAKHDSVSKVCMHDRQGRLCRILEMWVAQGMVFSWCVDLTPTEQQKLWTTSSTTKKGFSQQYNQMGDYDHDDTIAQRDDSDIDISVSQPPPPLPTYEPNNDDRPYVCVFATTYLNGPRKNIISKLMKADYVAIWPPWTTVPISVDDADMYIHIVTRFMVDETRD